jgi:hypothetical protein
MLLRPTGTPALEFVRGETIGVPFALERAIEDTLVCVRDSHIIVCRAATQSALQSGFFCSSNQLLQLSRYAHSSQQTGPSSQLLQPTRLIIPLTPISLLNQRQKCVPTPSSILQPTLHRIDIIRTQLSSSLPLHRLPTLLLQLNRIVIAVSSELAAQPFNLTLQQLLRAEQLLARLATLIEHLLVFLALGFAFGDLCFELIVSGESFFVSGLGAFEGLLQGELVVRDEGPVPVAGADLLGADAAFVLEGLDVVWVG